MLPIQHLAGAALCLVALFASVCNLPRCSATELDVREQVSWTEFLARQDLVWEELPAAWHEGAFVGNGLLGAMIYRDAQGGLRFDIGRSDVVEHRPNGNHRLHLGEMLLRPVGQIASGTMRLDLWNAEARGEIVTDRGTITLRCLTHAEDLVTVVELQTTGEENGCRWHWRPGLPVNPRSVYHKEEATNPNPPGTLDEAEGTAVWTQGRSAGGEYAVARREQELSPNRRVLWLSVGESFPEVGGKQEAVAAVVAAEKAGLQALLDTHRDWWHTFYPQAFVSIPDARMESFYWIQMYKLASATRADRPAIDLMGPWFRSTPWPAIWWNLNIQLTYWPVYTANRLDLGLSLCNMLDAGFDALVGNVPPEMRQDAAGIARATSYDCVGAVGAERGNLLWACHNYWLQCRYAGDDDRLRQNLLPLLRRAVGYYLHILQQGDDGRLHLPVSISPEYPEQAPDTNYDLSLLRWGLTALLEADGRLGLADPLAPTWRETLHNLAPYPMDDNGLMVGAGVPFAQSHRHFSHLLMIYPLRLLNGEQPESRELIDRSLRHWISFEGALQGYSFTGAAAIAAGMGRGDEALGYMNRFLDRYVKPNTMYLEAGPVIETPLSAAQSVHELLLQSWGGTLRVFAAVPETWKDVTFHRLRGEGGFLVSAARREGRTQWVRIESLAGEPCRVRTDLIGPVQVRGARAVKAVDEGDGLLRLDLRQGESAVLTGVDAPESPNVAPVAVDALVANHYGSPKTPPIPQADDGGFDLHAAKAAIHGDTLFYEKTATKDNLGRWIDADDWASWDLLVSSPGEFQVIATYAGVAADRSFELLVAGRRLEHQIHNTGAWDAFRDFPLGRVRLSEVGRVSLSVKPVRLPGGGLMNLQRIRLVPAEG